MKWPSRLLISASMRRTVCSSTSGGELAAQAAGMGAATRVRLRPDGKWRAFRPKNAATYSPTLGPLVLSLRPQARVDQVADQLHEIELAAGEPPG